MILNELILSVVRGSTDMPLARVIDSVLAQYPPDAKTPSEATIRRRIDRLGAMGKLYLKKTIVVYPTSKR